MVAILLENSVGLARLISYGQRLCILHTALTLSLEDRALVT